MGNEGFLLGYPPPTDRPMPVGERIDRLTALTKAINVEIRALNQADIDAYLSSRDHSGRRDHEYVVQFIQRPTKR